MKRTAMLDEINEAIEGLVEFLNGFPVYEDPKTEKIINSHSEMYSI